jgi:hypothetical protein
MTKDDADRVSRELATEFKAHVEVEEVAPGRFRFEVFSRHFGEGSHLDRHDRGWKVIDRMLSREQLLDVSILLMFGPEDVDATLAAIIPS